MFNDKDLELFKKRHMTVAQIEKQLDYFKTGFPYLKLVSAATVGNGVVKLSEEEEKRYVSLWDEYVSGDGNILKFVPASGAASRMFKDLFAFLDSASDVPDNDFVKKFFDNIHKFAFFDDLSEAAVKDCGSSVDELIGKGEYKKVVAYLLKECGLNYGNKPKAVLKFHKIGGEVHTALAEQLEEGAQYAKNKAGKVNVHFTVSGEHRPLFEEEIKRVSKRFEDKYGVAYNVSMSEQKPSTDTIAVNMDNTPYRDADGNLLFRPGGHGALIENLNEVAADVVFMNSEMNAIPQALRIAKMTGSISRQTMWYSLKI